MSRIASLTDDQASAEAAPLMKAVQAKLGVVPNMIRTLAHSPAALRGYLSLSEALGSGTFGGAQRETVALAVAQANACGYCLSAHTMVGKGAGLSPEAILAARQGGAPLARFARAVTVSRGDLKPSDLEEARAAGLSDGQIIEVIAHVALNTLTNYVNRIAQTDIDFPVVTV